MKRTRDLIHYRSATAIQNPRTITELESRRFEFDRNELGDHAGGFTDLVGGSWFVVGATYGGVVVPANFPGKKVRFPLDIESRLLYSMFCKVRKARAKGGDKMAKSISVNEILAQAQAAQDAYTAAVEQRKAVRKVARTLADAGLLDDSDVAKVEEIFPARKSRSEEDAGE